MVRVILDKYSYDINKETYRLWIHFTEDSTMDYPARIIDAKDGKGGVFCGVKGDTITTLCIDFKKDEWKFFEKMEGIEVRNND